MIVNQHLPRVLTALLLTVAGLTAAAANPFESGIAATPANEIDKLVFGKLAKLNLQPANVCSDAVFVRRVYLDVIGTLPTAAEARSFLASKDANKRRDLIERLLQRDEFADYWAMKWSDLLRVKAEFPINLWPNAAQAYHRWIRTSIKENKPYDKFTRELLTASGSNFREATVNFYRAIENKSPEGMAQGVALTFMGERAEKWPKSQLEGMAVFFTKIGSKATSEWKEEIIFYDPAKTNKPFANLKTAAAVFPDGTKYWLTPEQDPREAFANWLIDPKNPWFTRNIANRAWSWLMGRGIIHEPDDIRADNPPSNPELLAYLQRELIAAHYDVKKLFRLILNSRTYQLSAIPKDQNPAGDANFSHYPVRRLDAEVLIDGLNQITGTTEKYSSSIPEPFTFVPEDQRSIALQDGSISSSFLELFGRPSRDTGLESERNNRPTTSQELHLINSGHIQRKLTNSPKLRELLQNKKPAREMAEDLYLTILSRYPTEEELKIVQAARASSSSGPKTDIVWALINTSEFLYRH